MANKNKGEVSLKAGDKTYNLALTLNAMCELEEMFSKDGVEMTFEQIATKAETNQRYLRAFLWAVLQRDHPEIVLKREAADRASKDVSDVIEEAGGLVVMAEVLKELERANNPDKRDIAALGQEGRAAAGNPRKAGRGTSVTSTSTPGALASAPSRSGS